MPVDLTSIPQQDRQDYESRLRVYGMDLNGVQEPLTVSGQVTLGYGPKVQSARQPFVVQTKDFAAVKRMVGIDDRVAQKFTTNVTLPSRIQLASGAAAVGAAGSLSDASARRAFVAAPGQSDDAAAGAQFDSAMLAQLDTDSVDNVRLAARAFVRGNSAVVASYRPIIEATIGTITIPVFALLNVTVSAGSVLEFGPGVHALVAYQLTIENGGMIRSRGHLTVSCTKLVKPSGRIVTSVGSLTNVATAGTFRPIFSS